MTKRRKRVHSYVYTVTYNYDSYDHYSIGVAHNLATAKALAQEEWTDKDMGEPVTLVWDRRVSVWRGEKDTGTYYYAPTNPYGAGYQIDKQRVMILREVP